MANRVQKLFRQYKERMKTGELIPCGLCGEPILRASGLRRLSKGGKGGLSIDHIIPLNHGGTSRTDNLQPAHVRCNIEKGCCGIMGTCKLKRTTS